MLTESSSNILKEAHNLGVKVTSEKTFLTFDKENTEGSTASSSGPGASALQRRRFTTTDLVLNKELMDHFRDIEASSLSLLEQLQAVSDIHGLISESGDEVQTEVGLNDPRRTSLCSNITAGMEDWSVCGGAPQLINQSPPSAFTHASQFTTVMIRNVPNRYTQDDLISYIKSMGFRFNFFYAPIDRHSRAGCGYFFINLLGPELAVAFIHAFQGLQLPAYRSSKVCSACWARIQGYSANIDQYKTSPVMQLTREFRPRIFDPDMKEVGFIEDYMRPDSKLRKVFVGGLAPTTRIETMKHHLSQFGEIEDVSIILDSATRTPRGFAFVTFVDQSSVTLCVESKHLHFIDGRSVGIRPYSRG